MQNEQIFNSIYTGEEMDSAFSVALGIANHMGIPKGTGNGSIQILPVDTDRLTSDGERIPTSAVVAKSIAEARKISEVLTFKGVVQTTADLPSYAKPGSVYIVAQEDNENYAWDGVSWTPIGKLIAPIAMTSQSVAYQLSDSGESAPSGEWLTEFPGVQKGKYLWTRVIVQFSIGEPITSYSCAYNGDDGSGAVATVCGVSPDATGNVPLTAADVGALPTAGGSMTGPINMNGQTLSGLNSPTEDTQAATKGYVDGRTAADVGARPDTWMPTASDVGALSVSGGDMAGPINMNGQTLSGLNSPTEDTQAANKGYVDGKLSMELIWENDSPNSAFDGGITIGSLDLSGYTYIRILFHLYIDTNIYGDSGLAQVGKKMRIYFLTDGTSTVGGSYRDFDTKTKTWGNGIRFAGGATVNSACIPWRIYGVKGVS